MTISPQRQCALLHSYIRVLAYVRTLVCRATWPVSGYPQERSAERGRLHQVGERHQPVKAAPRRDHQPAEEHRGASGAGGGVRAAANR